MKHFQGPRVLHLIDSAGMYGAEIVMLMLCEETSKQGKLLPFVGCISKENTPKPEVGIKAENKGLSVNYLRSLGKFDFSLLVKIISLLRRERIDLVHSHGYKASIFGTLSCIALKRKIISTVHSYFPLNHNIALYQKMEIAFLKKVDRVVAVSDRIRADLVEQGVAPQKVRIVYNGVNLPSYSAYHKRNYGGNLFPNVVDLQNPPTVIGSVGMLKKVKGFKDLIQAAEKISSIFSNVIFSIAGDGPQRDKLEDLIRTKRLERCFFLTGYQEDIPYFLSQLDIFCLPSLSEGTPVALLEAMAAKKPIVASAVGSVPKIIRSGDSGILISPRNVEQMVEALIFLIQHPVERKRLAENAFDYVRQNHSREKMYQQYEAIYWQALGQ